MMGRLLFRIVLLAVGLGAVEIGLVAAIGQQAPLGWLPIMIGLVLLVAGSAGFMVPLLGGRTDPGGES
jgi:hypothetical protein